MQSRLAFDAAVHHVEAIQKAAYRFIDRLTIVISQQDNHFVCEVEPNPGLKLPVDEVLSDFKREVLDQELRFKIKNETEAARNLILAYAFSQSGLQG